MIKDQQQIHFLYSNFSPSCSHEFSITKINSNKSKTQIHFLLSLYFSPFSYSFLQELMESDRRSIKDSFSSRFFLFTSLRIRGKWSKINNGFIFFIPIFPDHESCLFFFLFLSIYLVHEFSRTKINSNESKMQIHFLLSLYFSPFSYSFLQELVESDRRSIKDSFFSRFFLFTSSKTRGKWSKINKRFIFFIPIFPHLVHTFIFQDWVENANSFSSRFFLFTSSSTRSTTDSFSLFHLFPHLVHTFTFQERRSTSRD